MNISDLLSFVVCRSTQHMLYAMCAQDPYHMDALHNIQAAYMSNIITQLDILLQHVYIHTTHEKHNFLSEIIYGHDYKNTGGLMAIHCIILYRFNFYI